MAAEDRPAAAPAAVADGSPKISPLVHGGGAGCGERRSRLEVASVANGHMPNHCKRAAGRHAASERAALAPESRGLICI
jgi:hypothetical protein